MLTYIQINAAKPRDKEYALSDSQGLYLTVRPNGSKLWRFKYRFLDKQKTLYLGGWPTISLADARVRRDEAKKLVANGIDPALEKKRARIAAKYAAANTFEAVAEEWLVKCERDGLAPVTVDKIRWLLAKAYPWNGTIPIAQITPHEALAVVRKVEATGAYESARRMRSVLSRVFRYGVAIVRCDMDVAADLRGVIAVPKVMHFTAITRLSEVGTLLRAIDGYTGHKVTVTAMPGRLRPGKPSTVSVRTCSSPSLGCSPEPAAYRRGCHRDTSKSRARQPSAVDRKSCSVGTSASRYRRAGGHRP